MIKLLERDNHSATIPILQMRKLRCKGHPHSQKGEAGFQACSALVAGVLS